MNYDLQILNDISGTPLPVPAGFNLERFISMQYHFKCLFILLGLELYLIKLIFPFFVTISPVVSVAFMKYTNTAVFISFPL